MQTTEAIYTPSERFARELATIGQRRPDVSAVMLRTAREAIDNGMSITATKLQAQARLERVCGRLALHRYRDPALFNGAVGLLMQELRRIRARK